MATHRTDYFWTDIDQARERLNGTLVTYDSQPVYISEVVESDAVDDRCPRARLYFCDDPSQKLVRKTLNSPKFNNFRTLPALGFINLRDGGTVFVKRRVRTTRSHGLSPDNTVVSNLSWNENGLATFRAISGLTSIIFRDEGFANLQNKKYPSLSELLEKLPLKSCGAFSPKFALVRDSTGIRLLYRNEELAGVFTDSVTLMLTETTSYLRQEIMEDACMSAIKNITEY
jgi:hypothetical protein